MSTRRQFLGSLAAASLVTASPNDRIHLAIIGTGGRAMFESKYWPAVGGFEVVALCDVQEARRKEAKAAFEKWYGDRGVERRGIVLYSDFRELLRNKDVDAVYIATPDHWHVPMLIEVQKAGKAVHCEKPLGVSIEQDFAALRAVKKYARPFFYGPERRSCADSRHAIELVLNGRIGKVRDVYVASPASESGGSAASEPVPAGVDWDMWLGPAPKVPYAKDRMAGMFHIYDYCLGFISNWGTHPLDQVQWWADNAGMGIPVNYRGRGTLATGGLYNCATAWDLECTYADGTVLHYMDNNTFNAKAGVPHPRAGKPPYHLNDAAIFVGSDGMVAWTYAAGVVTEPSNLADSVIGPNEKHLVQSPLHPERAAAGNVWEAPAAAHQLAWLETLQTGKPGVHSIETAVATDVFCQLCDLVVRTGAPLRWDPKEKTITGNDEARKRMSRPMRDPWKLG